MKEELKICISCKHCKVVKPNLLRKIFIDPEAKTEYMCAKLERVERKIDLVSGEVYLEKIGPFSCERKVYSVIGCGPEGKYWESKE